MHHFDSRKIMPGDTFICLPGGDIYIDDARKRGATYIVKMTREEMAEFSDSLFYLRQGLCVLLALQAQMAKLPLLIGYARS